MFVSFAASVKTQWLACIFGTSITVLFLSLVPLLPPLKCGANEWNHYFRVDGSDMCTEIHWFSIQSHGKSKYTHCLTFLMINTMEKSRHMTDMTACVCVCESENKNDSVQCIYASGDRKAAFSTVGEINKICWKIDIKLKIDDFFDDFNGNIFISFLWTQR